MMGRSARDAELNDGIKLKDGSPEHYPQQCLHILLGKKKIIDKIHE